MLPGIVSDRFYKIAKDTRADGRITEDALSALLTTVFCGKFSDKMNLTFQMFDFDNDGFITAEDVRLVLSYIPFKTSSNVKKIKNRSNSVSSSESEISISSEDNKEGCYG
jgi:Ca2+-binding EF-hand superfamily protein